jgi:hypothetical protein
MYGARKLRLPISEAALDNAEPSEGVCVSLFAGFIAPSPEVSYAHCDFRAAIPMLLAALFFAPCMTSNALALRPLSAPATFLAYKDKNNVIAATLTRLTNKADASGRITKALGDGP